MLTRAIPFKPAACRLTRPPKICARRYNNEQHQQQQHQQILNNLYPAHPRYVRAGTITNNTNNNSRYFIIYTPPAQDKCVVI